MSVHGRPSTDDRPGLTGRRNAVVPQRPQAAVVAARCGIAGAVLLLGSVVVLLVAVLGGSSVARWPAAVGVLLTCAVAGAGVLGARSLLRGRGRGLLLTAAWVQVGVLAVALGTVGVDVARGLTGGGTAVAVLVGCVVGLALAVGTIRLGERREVGGWLAASRSWQGLTPGRRPVDRVAVALAVPVALLALGTAVAVAVAPGSSGPRPFGGDLSPASPPPATTDAGFEAEFAPEADGCAAGSMSACDDLYWESLVRDAYERYAATCGGRLAREVDGGCVALLGSTLD